MCPLLHIARMLDTSYSISVNFGEARLHFAAVEREVLPVGFARA
jgi:hypothetical protein